MKVFISWSGQTSKSIAQALTNWLGNVIQAAKPWMSSENIEKGARWNAVLGKELEESKVGIICVTPDNITAPWLNFEAGALSKTLDSTYVCPFLFGLEPTELTGPLVQFQITKANKVDVKKLIVTINRALGDDAIPEKNLDDIFEVWWPRLENQLESISLAPTELTEIQRPERDMISEMLELVRKLDRDVNNLRDNRIAAQNFDITWDKLLNRNLIYKRSHDFSESWDKLSTIERNNLLKSVANSLRHQDISSDVSERIIKMLVEQFGEEAVSVLRSSSKTSGSNLEDETENLDAS